MAALVKAAFAAFPILSYLDAKYMVKHDLTIITSYISTRVEQVIFEKRDRLSPFYLLEDLATSSKPEVANRPFLIYEGRTWSYKEAHETILRYATWLKERYHVKKGDIVALDFMNKPSLIWVWFGLWAVGARPAMINYNLGGERLIHCVKTSTATLVIVDGEVRSVLEGEDGERTRRSLETEGGEREIVVFDEATERVVDTWRAVRPDDEERGGVKLPDMAMLIYTSGTTGMPKAAIISFQKLHFGAGFCHRYIGLKTTDRFYTCMPLYHSSAAILAVTQILHAKCTLSLGHKFSTKTFWRDVRMSEATIIQYVGETCRYLLAAPADPVNDKNHKVRMAFGNGLRPDVWSAFKNRFGIDIITEFYASTEGSSGSWNYQEGEWGAGAVGRSGGLLRLILGGGVKVAKMDEDSEDLLRDANGFAVECAPMESGEVLWKLDPDDIKKSFQGYYKNGKATDEKILRNVFKQGDAWFRTGDLQRLSPEGFWYFVDRIGDTFRWKSENVSTAEVAEVLGAHPAIVEANVYGVELPNHDGRAGCACVVLTPNSYNPPSEGDDKRELQVKQDVMNEVGAYIEKQLPRYAKPIFLRVTQEMETTGSLKHVKHELKAQGVDPDVVEVGGADRLWWLKGGCYVKFGKKDWEGLKGGSVKL